MSVALVVDGGVSLPEGYTEGSLQVVPMRVRTAEGEFADRDLARADLLRQLASGVTTAAPSPGDFLAAIEAADEGSGVLVVTVAARLSASFEAARLACEMAAPDHDIRLVDSATATVGEGLVTLAALRAAASGLKLDLVAASANRAAERVRLAAQISDLTQLARGGRVPSVAARASRATGLRPVIVLEKGEIRPLRPALGRSAAEGRLVELLVRSRVPAARLHVAALYGREPVTAEGLVAAVAAQVHAATSYVAALSPVMLAHTGPDVTGLSWWWEGEDEEADR